MLLCPGGRHRTAAASRRHSGWQLQEGRSAGSDFLAKTDKPGEAQPCWLGLTLCYILATALMLIDRTGTSIEFCQHPRGDSAFGEVSWRPVPVGIRCQWGLDADGYPLGEPSMAGTVQVDTASAFPRLEWAMTVGSPLALTVLLWSTRRRRAATEGTRSDRAS